MEKEILVPEIVLNSGHKMPTLGLGTAAHPMPPPDQLTSILIEAIASGYRHFDTAASYGTEEVVGRAVAAAVERGLIKNRDQVFVTSKLFLGLEYVDLYLIHWPIRIKQNMLHFDVKEVWDAMEECSKLGLAKSIGVSNFSCAKLSKLLEFATIPPAVNQVCTGNIWHQSGYFVALRWIHEQGASSIVKSFSKERMKENLQIFDWELTDEEVWFRGERFVSPEGQYKSLEELWDGEI
ncbi:hypothetical protein Pfo_011016 [Paulownia fortunei]|nr:hypothetical protein Pfo_011016 [Paulownia fortunei]